MLNGIANKTIKAKNELILDDYYHPSTDNREAIDKLDNIIIQLEEILNPMIGYQTLSEKTNFRIREENNNYATR